jgi:phage-related protein
MYKFLEENSYIIMALVIVLILVYITKVQKKIEEFAWFRRAARSVSRGVKKAGRAAGGAIKKAVKKAVDKVKRKFKKIINKIKKAAMKVVNEFKKVFKKIGKAFKNLWNIIKKLPKKIMKFMGKILYTVSKTFGSFLWKGMVVIFKFIAKLTKNFILLITKPIRKHVMFVGAAFALFGSACGCAAYLYYIQLPKKQDNSDIPEIIDPDIITIPAEPEQPVVP